MRFILFPFLFSNKIRIINGIPNVITGKNHTINRPSNVVCIGVKFLVGDQEFVIEVALKPRPEAD